MFNGWDADIVIEDIKTAVLWNGIWHYKKITKKHSVAQVQNRDKIKIDEIKKGDIIPMSLKIWEVLIRSLLRMSLISFWLVS